jgi:hypothetical protein
LLGMVIDPSNVEGSHSLCLISDSINFIAYVGICYLMITNSTSRLVFGESALVRFRSCTIGQYSVQCEECLIE